LPRTSASCEENRCAGVQRQPPAQRRHRLRHAPPPHVQCPSSLRRTPSHSQVSFLTSPCAVLFQSAWDRIVVDALIWFGDLSLDVLWIFHFLLDLFRWCSAMKILNWDHHLPLFCEPDGLSSDRLIMITNFCFLINWITIGDQANPELWDGNQC